MPYLLDTNIVNLIRNGNETVIARWEANLEESFINGIVVEEIISVGYFAAINTIRTRGRGDLTRAYEDLLKAIRDLSFFNQISYTSEAEVRFKSMKLKGMDGRIAAHALELGYTVVTQNTRDFAKIPGITLVDWTE